jgi:hypothetical protein
MKRGLLIVFLFTVVFMANRIPSHAQSIPNTVLNSGAFEAEFHFDVFYSIVNCDGATVLLLTAFNESGAKTDVGFDLEFSDALGNKQSFKVPIFKSKPSEMLQSSCTSDEHSFLKFAINNSFDFKTITGNIKFYSK